MFRATYDKLLPQVIEPRIIRFTPGRPFTRGDVLTKRITPTDTRIKYTR